MFVPQIQIEAEQSRRMRLVCTNILKKEVQKSDLWKLCSIQLLDCTEQERQGNDPAFLSLLNSNARNTISKDAPLAFRSTSNMYTASQFLWKWLTEQREEDVYLRKVLIAYNN